MDEWAEKAACRGYLPFFDLDREHIAYRMCQECIVFARCEQHVIKNKEEYGVWAGKRYDNYGSRPLSPWTHTEVQIIQSEISPPPGPRR